MKTNQKSADLPESARNTKSDNTSFHTTQGLTSGTAFAAFVGMKIRDLEIGPQHSSRG